MRSMAAAIVMSLSCGSVQSSDAQQTYLTEPDRCSTATSTTDGIHCVIQASRVAVRVTSRCGADADGNARKGEFRIDVVRYEDWNKGAMRASWYDNRETLIRCR
ncbi:MAG: hypothetical protein EON58_05965 [Alphaproteobacteria bacterium]|nr:MAG: hypothetical protein EON58_05965 [Alphaproteobacteria bacterium]